MLVFMKSVSNTRFIRKRQSMLVSEAIFKFNWQLFNRHVETYFSQILYSQIFVFYQEDSLVYVILK